MPRRSASKNAILPVVNSTSVSCTAYLYYHYFLMLSIPTSGQLGPKSGRQTRRIPRGVPPLSVLWRRSGARGLAPENYRLPPTKRSQFCRRMERTKTTRNNFSLTRKAPPWFAGFSVCRWRATVPRRLSGCSMINTLSIRAATNTNMVSFLNPTYAKARISGTRQRYIRYWTRRNTWEKHQFQNKILQG